jgi:hypothetical protein
MRSYSSEDEERFTIGAFPEDPLATTPVSMGSMRRPLTETSVTMVIQRVLAAEP